MLLSVLYAAARSETTLLQRCQATFGKWSPIFYLLFAMYYLFAALLPLLDLEKFTYAVFFDTAPTVFYFAAFFLFSGFFAAKGIKSIGRISDLCLFLFLLPFLALIIMSFTEADFSHLLPLFGTDFSRIKQGIHVTSPHFSDIALLLPLIANCPFSKNNHTKNTHLTGGKPIFLGYVIGGVLTMLFFAVFYALFGTLAPREHYAFAKIGQYFPALEIIGRVDLLFVYLLTIVLLFYTCLPIHYATGCIAKTLHVRRRTWISTLLNFALFLFALFGNRFYNRLYQVISIRLAPVFWIVADMLPLFLLFLPKNGKPFSTPPNTTQLGGKKSTKENANA